MAGDAAVASAFSTAGSAFMSYGLNADLGTNQNNNPYAMLNTSGYNLHNLTNVNTSFGGTGDDYVDLLVAGKSG